MPLPKRQSGQDWRDVDAIDLTLSSPEPEKPPQRRTQEHSRSYFNPEIKGESSRSAAFGRSSHQPVSSNPVRERGRQSTRPVNPDHLARIIQTSDSASIRKVLTDLCKMSPALSGAVARGLASNSSFAQDTINTYRVKSEAPRIKPDPYRHRTPAARAQSAGRPAGLAATQYVKRESGPSPVYNQSTMRTVPQPSRSTTYSRQSLQGTSSGMAAPGISLKSAVSSRRHSEFEEDDEESDPNTCLRCEEIVKGRQGNCIYHPGSKKIIPGNEGPAVIYSCCKKIAGEPGCTFGTHTTRNQIAAGPLNIPYSLKKPRID